MSELLKKLEELWVADCGPELGYMHLTTENYEELRTALAVKPGVRSVELDLNETGFLCNMIMTTYMATNPPRDPAGNMLMPEWLAKLFQKLAVINDQMMAEQPPAEQPSRIILPNHIPRH